MVWSQDSFELHVSSNIFFNITESQSMRYTASREVDKTETFTPKNMLQMNTQKPDKII